jgi:uncharacterized protein YkwD
VLILGAVEASLEPFPRAVSSGTTLRLRGQVASRFERAALVVTDARGGTREVPFAARAIDTLLPLDVRGTYQVEVIGFGADGPTVLVNVPIWVGVAEQLPASPGPATITSDPAVAEARLFELIQASRQKAGLNPLTADTELRAVALAHSQDMAKNRFGAHVSPSTGTVDDRLRRAGVRVSLGAENIAMHASPEGAHELLMRSPAHRGAILHPAFTHVGIGVVILPGPAGPQLFATQVFVRRPLASDTRPTADAIVQTFQLARHAQGLPPAQFDPVLAAAAEAAMRAYLASTPRSQGRATEAVVASIGAHVARTRQSRPGACVLITEIFEAMELANDPALKHRSLTRFGIAVRVLDEQEVAQSAVILVLESTANGPLVCQ